MRADTMGRDIERWKLPPSVSTDALFIDGSDVACHKLVYNLLAFTHHMEAARNTVARQFALTGPQYTIFMAIARLEGSNGTCSNAIARLLQVSQAFIALELKRLIAFGLVRKSVDPDDRRRLRLQTSPRGRAILQMNAELICKMNDMLFGSLELDEFRQLSSLASKLTTRSERTAAVLKTLCEDRTGAMARAAGMRWESC